MDSNWEPTTTRLPPRLEGGQGSWIREARHPDWEPEGVGLPMVEALAKIRDEVTGVLMQRHRGANRELAMVITKLDEARLWASEYDHQTLRRVTVDRTKVLRDMAEARARADTTVTTDGSEVSSV